MLEPYRSVIVLLILGVMLSGPLVASDTEDASGSESEAPAAEAGEVGFCSIATAPIALPVMLGGTTPPVKDATNF